MKKQSRFYFLQMKYFLLIIFAIGVLTAEAAAINVLPPKYLSVKNFQKCLGTKSMGTWNSWCIPKHKPLFCPKSSWEALNNLQKTEPMPKC